MDDARERETHLAQAQEIATVGSWHLDVREDDLQWSRECYRIFDVDPDESMTYERFLQCVHPEDRAYVESEWQAALESGEYDIEHRVLVDGETKWVREKAELTFDDEGDPVSGIGVVKDVTESKERERQVREQKRRYRSLFDSIRDAIVVVDGDGRIVNCNPAFTDLFGYELAEIAGELASLLYDDDGEFGRVAAAVEERDGDSHVTLRSHFRKRSGQVFPAETTIFERYDADGAAVGFIGVVRDVSNREDRLHQMKVIDRVLRHNIRNDLNVVQGFAETIARQSSDPVRSNAEKILETSDQLLDTANR